MIDARARQLFEELADRPPAVQEELLRERCGDDPELRELVLGLLGHDRDALGAELEPLPHHLARAECGGLEGRRIGPYVFMERIGEGGMGVVYRARQDRPRREVALKLVRAPLFDGERLRRRFEAEIAALGRLEHPSIARIYDAGTLDTDLGPQPFFAMELVEGRSLAEAAADLSTAGRVRLMIRLADAVQFAHQKGVVHRDLKPGNVLVRPTGEPAVLDFGIARSTDADLRATTVPPDSSEHGGLVGTLPYMSPEQVAGRASEVDVRSDVYALGVVLYELLAGRLPFDLEDVSLRDAVRTICEEDPPPLGALDPSLRGDLETIARKAMEKDPARRYPSAGLLAEDLRRHLASRPITARPPTLAYELSRLVRRHRVGFAGAAAVLVALVAGIVATTWQAREARAAERVARLAELDAVAEGERATRFAERAEASRREAERRSEELLRLADLRRIDELERRAAELLPVQPERLPAYRRWMEDAEALLARRDLHAAHADDLRARLDALEAGGNEATELRWWIGSLETLLVRLDAFADEEHGLVAGRSADHGWGVQRRIDLCERMIAYQLSDARARAWREVVEAVADPARCPIYGGLAIEPRPDLVPIGQDPRSGLWEFVHGATGEAPARDPETGALAPTDATGIVLVLLPGGTFTMGAQREDPGAPGHDPLAAPNEGPPHEVTVEPFLVSKYELTMDQWERLTGERPFQPAAVRLGGRDRLPADSLTWTESMRVLAQFGLTLPTEPQWEYAARGGTETPWWTGSTRESLLGAANLADRSAPPGGKPWAASHEWPELDDGYWRQSPIDAFPPNPFGLHDVLGNLTEMGREPYGGFYDPPRKVAWPPRRTPLRGGSFAASYRTSRVTGRTFVDTDTRNLNLGVRPVRLLE